MNKEMNEWVALSRASDLRLRLRGFVVANAAQAVQQVPGAPTEPVAPGDPVAANFDQASFLARLRAGKYPRGGPTRVPLPDTNPPGEIPLWVRKLKRS